MGDQRKTGDISHVFKVHQPHQSTNIFWKLQLSRQFNLEILSILSDQFFMIVFNRPLFWEMLGLHSVQEVLAPSSLQLHEGAETPFGKTLYYFQTMWHIGLITNPEKGKQNLDSEKHGTSWKT